MHVLVFLNSLGLGGTEKAACCWAIALKSLNHKVDVLTLRDGPRRQQLETAGISVTVASASPAAILDVIKAKQPTVIHAHCPGYPHEGDNLGEALKSSARKIPVIQTNIFGRLENPTEDAWTRSRLFISWTSCVQAAERAGHPLNHEFFRTQSMASYPVEDPWPTIEARETLAAEARILRCQLNIASDEVLFGRFSRPEPNKWTDLPLEGFLLAASRNQKIRLLLREPPPEVAARIRRFALSERILILPATSNAHELAISQMACDAVLHGSLIGESFGYGIAEPMALGKPVITNSTPWLDQAQIELVHQNETGFLASTPQSTALAIGRLAGDPALRQALGEQARKHILRVADFETSTKVLEETLQSACSGSPNAHADTDLKMAISAQNRLHRYQWGYCWGDQLALRLKAARVIFGKWRRSEFSAR